MESFFDLHYCDLCMSLRGREGLFLDLKGLNRYWNEKEDLVKIVLLGKVKGELRERAQLNACKTVLKFH